jgi:SAM-dependent methyltransferase
MTATATMSRWGAAETGTERLEGPEIQMETVPCPGCQGTSFEPILKGGDHLTRLGGEFSLVRCAHCQLALTNPRPVAESLGYFYPSNYTPYDPSNSGSLGWWSQLLEDAALQTYYGYPQQPVNLTTRLLGRLALTKFRSRRKRHEWFPYRESGKLLDVGCGGGKFLERMRHFGWNVTGIDLAADVAQRVQQRTGIKVYSGTLPHADLKPQSFDAVTMWHLLEHVPDPRALLKYRQLVICRIRIELVRTGIAAAFAAFRSADTASDPSARLFPECGSSANGLALLDETKRRAYRRRRSHEIR